MQGTLTPPPPSLSSASNPSGDPSPSPPMLPSEIMEDILYRLPVKPLSQLRCVCKSWNSLISDPKFARNHLRRSSLNPTRHRLIFTPSRILQYYPSVHTMTTHATRLDHPLHNPYQDSVVVASCDGMLCITTNQQRDTVLWNPSIQKSKKLPTLEGLEPYFGIRPIVYGFGYDHVLDNYKVVAVFRDVCVAKIHTLGTDSWRMIKYFPSSPSSDAGQLVRGTLNWLSVDSRIIISFDLVKECCQELCPPDYGGGGVNATLEVLRDCLCIFCNTLTFADVWVMNEYGNRESWTKLFRVSDGFNPVCTSVLYYVYEDDEVVVTSKTGAIVYNYINGTSRSPDTEYSTKISEGMVPYRYIESLISPCLS